MAFAASFRNWKGGNLLIYDISETTQNRFFCLFF